MFISTLEAILTLALSMEIGVYSTIKYLYSSLTSLGFAGALYPYLSKAYFSEIVQE